MELSTGSVEQRVTSSSREPDSGYAADGMKSAASVRDEDLRALLPFSSSVKVTRLRGDLARPALVKDLDLTAAANQAGLPNERAPGKVINKVCDDRARPPGYVKSGGCNVGGGEGQAWLGVLALARLAAAIKRSRR